MPVTRRLSYQWYETPNIHTHGWIDITGPDFARLASETLGVVYPSCAEACCGSVINVMHAGVIPIVSRQTGIGDNLFDASTKFLNKREVG